MCDFKTGCTEGNYTCNYSQYLKNKKIRKLLVNYVKLYNERSTLVYSIDKTRSELISFLINLTVIHKQNTHMNIYLKKNYLDH